MRAEELEISTIIKNQKAPFIGILTVHLVNAVESLTKPRAATDHLPELRLRPHLLEKYQVHALGHVNAGIHHIHGYCDIGRLVRLFEIVNDGLGIGIVTDHPLDKASLVFRIQLVEALADKFRVPLILGENDGFPQPVASRSFNAALHQILQHDIHRTLIEDKLIHSCGRNKVRQPAVLGKIRLEAFLVLYRQFIVVNAFLQKLGLHFVVVVGHQNMILLYRRLVIIGIGGHAMLHLEELVCIPIHIRLWRGRKSHHDGIEIIKNRAVLLENTAMTLIDDDQVKVRGCKQPHAVPALRIVDGIQHSRIGREDNAGIPIILVAAEITKGHVRQIVLEVILRLLHQRRPIRKEEDIGGVPSPAQHIRQAGDGSRFSRTGGHHQQMLPKALLDLLTYRADSILLIVAIRNAVVDGNAHEIQAILPPVHQLLEIILAEDTTDRPLRAADIVPEIRLKSIGGEGHRTLPEFLLQSVRVESGLLSAVVRILAAPLRLHHSQRQPVFSEKHIVTVALLTDHTGHAVYRIFLLHISICAGEFPTHLLHIHIDIDFPGFVFANVFGLEAAFFLMLFFLSGKLLGKGLDLLAKRFYFRILFAEKAFLLLNFLCVYDDLLRGNPTLIKFPLLVLLAVAIVYPLNELKQTLQGHQGIALLDAFFGMDSQVSQLNDERKLAPGIVIHREAEAGLVNQ